MATASLERSARIEHFGQQGSWSLLHDDLVHQNIVWGPNGEPARDNEAEHAELGRQAGELQTFIEKGDAAGLTESVKTAMLASEGE